MGVSLEKYGSHCHRTVIQSLQSIFRANLLKNKVALLTDGDIVTGILPAAFALPRSSLRNGC